MSVGGGGWAGYDVYSQVSSHPFCAIFYPPYARHAAVLLVQETSGCVCVCGGGGIMYIRRLRSAHPFCT